MLTLKKKRWLLILLFALQNSFSQIHITELYIDSPYVETNYASESGLQHHLGEYIELYNYTNQDINLGGWSITDKVSKFIFPENTIISSESFLLVAYRPNPTAGNYIPLFFPTTVGKDSQIIYQDQVILRNPHENIKLNMGMLGGIDFGGYPISFASWNTPLAPSNQAANYQNPSQVNFYINSLHFAIDHLYYATANPLEESELPPTVDLQDAGPFREAVTTIFTGLTWAENARELLEMICELSISDISQAASGSFTEGTVCFTYDLSGNYTLTDTNCEDDTENSTSPSEQGYSETELEDISSKISLYPNPTSGAVNIVWDASISTVITSIQFAGISGNIININPVSTSSISASYDITVQPTGNYIVKFSLDSGQFISKIVIKI